MPSANDAVWLDVLPNMSKFGPSLAKGATAQSSMVGAASGKTFGKAMLAGVAVVAGGAVLATKALYNVGKTFNEMSNTIIVGTGASGKALESLEKSALNVGKNTPSSFEDIGTAIADVNTRLGLTGKPLEALSGQFLNLSRITGTDLTTNIANASRVFGDWGITVKDQPAALDAIFEATKRTGIGLDKLTDMVVQFGAPLRQFGFDFEESLALFGKWEKEGVNTQVILAGLKAGLGKFSKAGKDPQKALKQTQKAIMDAGSAGEANAIAIEAFGQRAGPDMAAAVREGRFELGDMVKGLKNSEGAIDDADKRTRTFTESWQLFKNRAMVAVKPAATALFDALGKGMEWVNSTGIPRLKDFARWMKANEKPIKIIGGVILSVLIPALAVAGIRAMASAARQVAAWLLTQAAAVKSAAVHAAKVAFMVAKWAFLGVKAMLHAAKIAAAWLISMGPIGLVIAAVVGLVVVIVKNWDKIKSVISRGWDWVKSKTVAFWERGMKPIFDKLTGFMTKTIPEAFRRGRDLIGKAWDGIKALAAKPVNFVIDTVYNNGIRKGFNFVAGKLGSKATLPRMSTIGSGGGGGGGGGGRSAPGMNLAAAGGAGGIGSLVKKVAGKAWGWVKDKFMSPINSRLSRVGSSPWAQMMSGAGRKLAGAGLDKLKSIFGAAEGDGATGPMGKAGVILPRGQYRIGMPYLGYPGHYGADYPAATGTPVYSMANGRVSKATTIAGSYGKHVYIDHPGGIQTRYAHLNGFNVRAGQTIRGGQMLGSVGSTGNSTGPHLHFEYRRNGSPRNPATLGLFDGGGMLRQGMLAYHAARKPDRVLTDSQWSDMHKIAQRGGGSGHQINVTMPATATPEAAYEAAGGRIIAALSAGGV